MFLSLSMVHLFSLEASSNVYQALPPALEVSERARTVAGDGERWHAVKKTVVNRVEIDPDTHVR